MAVKVVIGAVTVVGVVVGVGMAVKVVIGAVTVVGVVT
jgi:hypothetical protein